MIFLFVFLDLKFILHCFGKHGCKISSRCPMPANVNIFLLLTERQATRIRLPLQDFVNTDESNGIS
jgi:hypothetical protein